MTVYPHFSHLFFYILLLASLLRTPSCRWLESNFEIARIIRKTISGQQRELRECEGRKSLLRRFVRISRPRPDSDNWFYVETANGSGSKICRPNLPVSAASGPAASVAVVSPYSLVSRPKLLPYIHAPFSFLLLFTLFFSLFSFIYLLLFAFRLVLREIYMRYLLSR